MTQRNLAYLGFLGGLFWLGLFLFPPDFGYPGTFAYTYYQWYNRLWTPVLLLMACGFLAFRQTHHHPETLVIRWAFRVIFLGFGLMMLGNTAEFWFFTTLPYGEWNMRTFAWLTVLLGALILLIAAFILGIAWLRSRSQPVWVSVLCLLALPLTLVGIFQGFMFLPLAPLTWVMSGLALRPSADSPAELGSTF
ncbi:MAG: hypothetical protein IPL78_35745 [Chloroflexi bacterium]|nr:hypothetical protein [Chloroflexota bacterium]